MGKNLPWIDEAEKESFLLSEKEIVSAFKYRKMIDADYGKRMNSEYIISHGWDVLLLPHDNRDCGDKVFSSLFDKLAVEYKDFLYALPTLSEESEAAINPPELEFFEPPLVAKYPCNYDGFVSARRGLVNIFSNSFYLFAKHREFCMLNVEGRYSMFAGPHDFLGKIFPQDPRSTWSTVSGGGFFEAQEAAALLVAMGSLGYRD